MEYFKINNIDYSKYVNSLSVNKVNKYNSQTNAAGDTVVDYINAKYTITVGFIPMDGAEAAQLLTLLDMFNVSISFREPQTNAIKNGVNCIVPNTNINYYTIQVNRVMYNTFTITFIEL